MCVCIEILWHKGSSTYILIRIHLTDVILYKKSIERNFVLKTAAKNRTCVTFLSRQGQRQCLQQQKRKSNETKHGVRAIFCFPCLYFSPFHSLSLSLSIFSTLILSSQKNLLQIKQATKAKIKFKNFIFFSLRLSGQFKRGKICIYFAYFFSCLNGFGGG